MLWKEIPKPVKIIIWIAIPTAFVILFYIVRYILRKMSDDYLKLPYINLVKENQKDFGQKVISISDDLGIKPEWLMAVMYNETAFTLDSKIKNPNSSATGLIQFTEATAENLDTTVDELVAMSNVDQLDYVKKYLKPYASKMDSLSNTYLAVFFPKALYEADTFIFPAWAVSANPSFFKYGNTKLAFADYVTDKYSNLA